MATVMEERVRRDLANGYDLRAGSVELTLRKYLPATKGRTSTERLLSIAGRAMADGTRLVRPKLKQHEREDLESHLFEVGVRCVHSYDPELDAGSGNVRLEVRFGRFAYLRMRMGLVDWLRSQRGDPRPGRSQVQETPASHTSDWGGEETSLVAGLLVEADFADDLVSRATVERWSRVARASGMTTTAWAIERLNAMADLEAAAEDAAA